MLQGPDAGARDMLTQRGGFLWCRRPGAWLNSAKSRGKARTVLMEIEGVDGGLRGCGSDGLPWGDGRGDARAVVDEEGRAV